MWFDMLRVGYCVIWGFAWLLGFTLRDSFVLGCCWVLCLRFVYVCVREGFVLYDLIVEFLMLFYV